jgi:hypothetical protein
LSPSKRNRAGGYGTPAAVKYGRSLARADVPYCATRSAMLGVGVGVGVGPAERRCAPQPAATVRAQATKRTRVATCIRLLARRCTAGMHGSGRPDTSELAAEPRRVKAPVAIRRPRHEQTDVPTRLCGARDGPVVWTDELSIYGQALPLHVGAAPGVDVPPAAVQSAALSTSQEPGCPAVLGGTQQATGGSHPAQTLPVPEL